jgi:ArsR family transcriptional regulator
MPQPRENQSQSLAQPCDFSSPRVIAAVAQYMRAMAHPTRVRIVLALSTRDLFVAQLVNTLRLSEPVISRHLTVLRRADITTCRRSGTHVSNHLADETALRAFDLAGAVTSADGPEWHL